MPVAVKDNFDTYDMPTTVGSLALIGNQPPRDAPFVERLRKAGAIIVGKTNMDELAMGIRGLSGAGGRVGNAYDTEQSAGGSSSGSAVAVGAGFVPLAVGSDNCGSLRIPAAYNGAVSLRATYGRFDVGGVFPIGFVNGVPGVIARDTATLRAALAVAGDGWRADAAETGGLRGKRIGVLRRFDRKDPWSPAEPETQGLFRLAIALIEHAGAEIVEDVALDEFNARLGPQFLKGFARRVDAAFDAYPAVRRNWRDVCQSGRIRPEWTARECMAVGASAAPLERRAVEQIAGNQRQVIAVMDQLRLDALLYPTDGRGGARADEFGPPSPASSPAPRDCRRSPFRSGSTCAACRSGSSDGPPASRRSPGGDDGCIRNRARIPARPKRTPGHGVLADDLIARNQRTAVQQILAAVDEVVEDPAGGADRGLAIAGHIPRQPSRGPHDRAGIS